MPAPSPADFILTAQERRNVHKRLTSLGLPLPAPSPSPLPSADTPAKTSKQPSTQPSSLQSPSFWLQDGNLPKTTRVAIRSALLAASVNSTLECVSTGVRRRSILPALRRILSPISFRLFACLLAFTALYRSFVQALIVVRRRVFEESKSGKSVPATAPVAVKLRQRAYNRLLAMIKGNASIAAVSALLASPLSLSFLPAGDAFPVASLALWLFTHSLSSLYNEGRTRGSRLVKWIPAWCDSSLLYAIGNGQLLWAFLFERDAFPKNYGNVILSRSSTYITPRPIELPPTVSWPTKQAIADHVAILATPTSSSSAFPSFTSPLLSSLSPKRYATSAYPAINPILDYAPAHPAHTQLMCALLHPREPSCSKTLVNHFKSEWLASARFAGAFAALASLVFRHRQWAKDPETEIFKVVVATLQGATVISGSIGTAWAMTCLLQKYLPRTFLPRARFFLNGLVSGIFILAVPKSRRRELGLYVARMSAASSWKILEKHGKVKPVSRGPHAILAVALAILAGLYEVNSQHLTRATRGVAGRVFGPRLVSGDEDSQEEQEEH